MEVRIEDVAAAQRVLEEEYRKSTGLDSHDQQFSGAVYDAAADKVVCPACGCTFKPDLRVCPECGLSFE